MSNLAYDNVIFAPQPQYNSNDVAKGAVNIKKQPNNEIDTDKIKIVHTVPKMTDIEREKSRKTIGNDLYEIFQRIQFQLKS